MKVMQRLWPIALAAAAACTKSSATRDPALSLDAKLPATFAQVSNVVELADGRVAFADTRERVFLIGDLGSGKVDTLGTRVDSLPTGAAASLYKFPGSVAHLAGDTVALVDFAAVRTTLWSDGGQPIGVLPTPPTGGLTPILFYDQRGNGYKVDYRSVMGGNEPGTPVRADSVAVLRVRLATGAADTAAQLSPPEFGEARFGEQRQNVARIFGPNDLFGVLPDGRIWVARARANRVDWRSADGEWVLGRPHEYEKVPVTEADKARVIARIRVQGKGRLPDSVPLVWPFAEQKPPFEAGMASPTGEVWLQRSRPLDAKDQVYDIWGPDGAWKRSLWFPPGVTLAGFGKNGAIYGIVKDGDRKTIGRYKLREQ